MQPDNEKPKDRFEDIDLFETWDDDYYRADHLSFYDSVIDYFIEQTGIQPEDEVLEAGCGPCVHTIRMIKKGLKCLSIDFSNTVLEEGKKRLSNEGLSDRVTLQQEDLTNLSFPDSSFSYVFCWGVIMHIPEPEKAIKELSRVLKPGGQILMSTCNANSFDKFLLEKIAYKLKRPKTLHDTGKSEMGSYCVFRENDNDLFVQALFPDKLEACFNANGVDLVACRCAELTEIYTLFNSNIIRVIFSKINSFWFRYIRSPFLCQSHILILKKA